MQLCNKTKQKLLRSTLCRALFRINGLWAYLNPFILIPCLLSTNIPASISSHSLPLLAIEILTRSLKRLRPLLAILLPF